jgi:hypothetical protein
VGEARRREAGVRHGHGEGCAVPKGLPSCASALGNDGPYDANARTESRFWQLTPSVYKEEYTVVLPLEPSALPRGMAWLAFSCV